MNNRPLFSILHPSARPDQWRKVYDDWMSKCVDPSQVEYVLCEDDRWGFEPYGTGAFGSVNGSRLLVVKNTGRRCYVDAVNAAAKASTGHILIVIADDQFACEKWDTELLKTLDAWVAKQPGNEPAVAREFVIEVSTGTPDEHNRGIFVMPIVSRPRYERLGYLFYPEYESMYADNDLCAHARQDGVVIDARRLMFPHRHVMFDGKGGWNKNAVFDEAYRAQMRREAFELGKRVFEARSRYNFPAQSHTGPGDIPKQRHIAICMPGESFSSDWVGMLWEIRNACTARGYIPLLCRQYTSNVYITRKTLAHMVLLDERKPELVLWIDDDNVATRDQFERLWDSLESKPDADVMAAWCWIHNEQTNVFYPSAGVFSPDGANWQPFQSDFVQGVEVTGAECTGFPFLLMKRDALVKAGGPDAFLPILTDQTATGVMGEDMSWCKRALAAGVNLYVDPKVKVMHVKERSPEPFIPQRKEGADVTQSKAGVLAGARKPRIAAMLRVKNEGRWIKRVIESIAPLCDAGIFVMDDGSTDNTRSQVIEAGQSAILQSPFAGQPLDEARDKNWLLGEVVKTANPDWILCIDGDEELEAGGVEKIRAAIRETKCESFTLRVPYLWNSRDHIRVDGIYSEIRRHSLFRARPEFHFQCLYKKSGAPCHTGLHCGNTPTWQMNPEASGNLEVNLWHYGYMLKEDRIRKYEWYNQVDPDNEIEDHYRHMVIGDLLPADTVTKFAGPLKLEPIPLSAVIDIKKFLESFAAPSIASYLPRGPIKGLKLGSLRLNLGCSDRLEAGFVNVDICEPADQIADLRIEWPWEDSSVDEIRAWDIIEHLPDAIHTMNEAFRALKPGGKLDIIVPTTDGRGAFQDPTHVSFWNRNSFFYFEAGNPHLHRFEKAYGIKCAFRVASSSEETLRDGVTKLHIILEAAKENQMMNAAD